jgi:hypothetical protein
MVQSLEQRTSVGNTEGVGSEVGSCISQTQAYSMGCLYLTLGSSLYSVLWVTEYAVVYQMKNHELGQALVFLAWIV